MQKTSGTITSHNIVQSWQRYFCRSITATLFFYIIVIYKTSSRNRHYCSQAHTTNFGEVIKLLAPISLMRILKHASPIHTAHLTRPFFLSEYKRKKWSGSQRFSTFYCMLYYHDKLLYCNKTIMIIDRVVNHLSHTTTQSTMYCVSHERIAGLWLTSGQAAQQNIA